MAGPKTWREARLACLKGIYEGALLKCSFTRGGPEWMVPKDQLDISIAIAPHRTWRERIQLEPPQRIDSVLI